MAKLDLISNEWTDLVFEGRNQEYGAYKLRKGTTKRNIWSIIIVGLAAVLLYLGLQLQHMVEANRQVENTQAIELSALEQKKKEAKVEKKEQVKVEPEKVVEKVKSSVKFTAPVIKKDNEVKEEDEIKLDEVEKSALMSWLSQNIKYPVIAAENGVQGRVIVQFVVEKDGSITDVKVAKSVDPSLDKEAARVVKSMPHWIPGKQNGSAVRVKYTVPVTFKLQ